MAFEYSRKKAARGSVIIETAVVLSLVGLVLAGTINFNMRLKEHALLAESLRVAGRGAALLKNIQLLPNADGNPAIGDVESFADILVTQRLIQAKMNPRDYEIAIDFVRSMHSASSRPVASVRIAIQGRSDTARYFGYVAQAPPCKSAFFRIDVTDPRAFDPTQVGALQDESALASFCQ